MVPGRGATFPGVRTLLLLLVLLVPAAVSAQGQLLSYSLKPAAQKGQGLPQILLKADSDFRKVTADCERSDGQEVSFSAGSTKRGKTLTFDLKQPDGTFHYRCEARGYYGSGDEEFFDLAFGFDAFLGGPLAIEVPRETIDLKGRSLVARADRPVQAAHITLIGPDGPFHDADVAIEETAAGDDVWMSWEAKGDILRMDVTLTDTWGFYSFENIFPWSLEIPHDDILFDTGSHEVTGSERPKVERAYGDVDRIVKRYSKYVEVRLYIAGYTDTVGDKASNQGLSERRARAIAEEFRRKGFSGPLYYQGFGEDALALATDDGVDEIANRRAIYLLASRPPEPGHNFPHGAWKQLP
jgi:flagellar motor protein MotB